MKKIYSFSRKVRVPLDNYNSNEYFLSIGVEYSQEDLDELSVFDKQEFKELAKQIDKIQREIILDETGISELPMDSLKRRSKVKERIGLKFRKKDR
jgi:hypothetical protein